MNNAHEKIKNVPTIEDLRRSGHKVRVYHARVYTLRSELTDDVYHVVQSKREFNAIPDDEYHIQSHGGYTRIDITTMSGSEYTAKFNVPSNKQFNRKLGIRVCLGKILKSMSN